MRFLYALLPCAALLVSGCTLGPSYSPRAHYSTFTDYTWTPETRARAPLALRELKTDAITIFTAGVHAFYDDRESRFVLEPGALPGEFLVTESRGKTEESAIGLGADVPFLYRNGRAVPYSSPVSVKALPDGRLLMQSKNPAVNAAVRVRAYDVRGKAAMHLMRTLGNQPSRLAYYTRDTYIFRRGSKAYQLSYWLGDDEIVGTSRNAFTGAPTLEKLLAQFSGKRTPFCLPFVSHQQARPYGLLFDTNPATGRRTASAPRSGTFSLVPVDSESLFCQREGTGSAATGTWKMRLIHGTRVIELTPDATVESANIGIQPVNRNAVSVGFAEVLRPGPVKAGVARTQVIPILILKNNREIVDFRLLYNEKAAEIMRSALADAARSEAADRQNNQR